MATAVTDRALRYRANPNRFEAVAVKYLQQVVNKYGQDNVQVKIKNTFPAYMQRYTDGSILMAVPNPTSAGKLNTFLHECCHALHDHGRGEPSSRAEYEAVSCARETMEREGVPVNKNEEEYDLGSVMGAVIDDINREVEPDARAASMIKRYLARENEEPGGKFDRALQKYERRRGHALI
jgi:hypothetical protein